MKISRIRKALKTLQKEHPEMRVSNIASFFDQYYDRTLPQPRVEYTQDPEAICFLWATKNAIEDIFSVTLSFNQSGEIGTIEVKDTETTVFNQSLYINEIKFWETLNHFVREYIVDTKISPCCMCGKEAYVHTSQPGSFVECEDGCKIGYSETPLFGTKLQAITFHNLLSNNKKIAEFLRSIK